VVGAAIGRAPYDGDSLAGQTDEERLAELFGPWNAVPYLFLVRNMFFSKRRYWPPFHPLTKGLVPFGFWSGPFWFTVGTRSRPIAFLYRAGVFLYHRR
jgi:hypothetical protein